VFHFPLQLFVSKNIWQVRLEMPWEIQVGLQVKCPLFCLVVTKSGMYQQILVQLPTITFNENLFSDSRVVSCIQMDSWTDFNDTPQGWNAPKHMKVTSYKSNECTLHIFLSKYCFMFLHLSVFQYILLKLIVRYLHYGLYCSHVQPISLLTPLDSH
jgi:hypothetical protein